jgi:hypothetical protein
MMAQKPQRKKEAQVNTEIEKLEKRRADINRKIQRLKKRRIKKETAGRHQPKNFDWGHDPEPDQKRKIQ